MKSPCTPGGERRREGGEASAYWRTRPGFFAEQCVDTSKDTLAHPQTTAAYTVRIKKVMQTKGNCSGPKTWTKSAVRHALSSTKHQEEGRKKKKGEKMESHLNRPALLVDAHLLVDLVASLHLPCPAGKQKKQGERPEKKRLPSNYACNCLLTDRCCECGRRKEDGDDVLRQCSCVPWRRPDKSKANDASYETDRVYSSTAIHQLEMLQYGATKVHV